MLRSDCIASDVAASAGMGGDLVVVLGSANSHPVPGLHGEGLAVTLALCICQRC